MSTAEDSRQVFKAVLAQYYHDERNRTERCLGDIVDILTKPDTSDSEQVRMIVERLCEHYTRSN